MRYFELNSTFQHMCASVFCFEMWSPVTPAGLVTECDLELLSSCLYFLHTGLQACDAMPDLHSTGDQMQSLGHASPPEPHPWPVVLTKLSHVLNFSSQM